jgi:nucleotide-binding universal stress UspA family protein
MAERQRRIVVGVDGSSASDNALRWAIDEAGYRGDVIEAVHVFSYPSIGGLAAAAGAGIDWEDLAIGARKLVADAVDRARGRGPSGDGANIHALAVAGAASSVLLDAAKNADLLVLGTRGHGSLSSLVLGSVSSHCSHHSSCPLVLVPPAIAAGDQPTSAKAEVRV